MNYFSKYVSFSFALNVNPLGIAVNSYTCGRCKSSDTYLKIMSIVNRVDWGLVTVKQNFQEYVETRNKTQNL